MKYREAWKKALAYKACDISHARGKDTDAGCKRHQIGTIVGPTLFLDIELDRALGDILGRFPRNIVGLLNGLRLQSLPELGIDGLHRRHMVFELVELLRRQSHHVLASSGERRVGKEVSRGWEEQLATISNSADGQYS